MTDRLQSSDLSYCRLPTLAGMAAVGELHRLFRTFLNLKTTCKKASLNLYSDSSNCQVNLKVMVPGKGYQTPTRGSGPSRARSLCQAPWLPCPPPAAATSAAATAPVPDRRARRRGPGALLQDKKRRLTHIELNLLLDPAAPAARQCDAAARHGGSKNKQGSL